MENASAIQARTKPPRHLAPIVALAALLAAALALAIPSPAQGASGYVALGDSYSSGVGARDYYEDSGDCQRSPDAYAPEAAEHIGQPLTFVACGGATTADVLDGQLGDLEAATTDVTISIGGNDAGFGDVLMQCAKPWPTTCWGDIDEAQDFINDELPARLDDVYGEIEARAPNAEVAVVGYPAIFNGEECNFGARISEGEQEDLNATGDVLADVIADRAAAWGFEFVDPRAAFDGHAVCDDDEWINGLSDPTGESYHPNDEGYDAYADLVVDAIG